MAKVNLGTEAAKIGVFVALVALMAKAVRKLDKGWFGTIFFRGSDR